MSSYLFPFGFAFFAAIMFIPLLSKVAHKFNFVDIPNKRKIHSKPVPLLGGVAVFASYIITAWLFVGPLRLKLAILISGSLVVGIGLIDDYFKTRKKDFPALPKFTVHIIVGLVLIYFGIRIQGITAFFGEGMVYFSDKTSILITLLWVIGIMNMINFLDGLDGLASGITIIASMTLFFISFIKGQEVIALLSIILMGSTLGFLKYNFFPAKIFLGDSGSVYLGLMLGLISIEGAIKSATILTVFMVVLALGVPIFDTIIVIYNRLKNHKPIYLADQNHAHHRLLKKGYSQKQAVTLIYMISIFFSLIASLVIFWLVI